MISRAKKKIKIKGNFGRALLPIVMALQVLVEETVNPIFNIQSEIGFSFSRPIFNVTF